MKNQKKNSLTNINKKPDIEETTKILESYTKPFDDAIKERLDYYKNHNVQWAKDLFASFEGLFEKVFSEPLKRIGKADKRTLNYLLFSFYLPIQEEAYSFAISKEKELPYEIFKNRTVASSRAELILEDKIADDFIRFKLSPIATLIFFYEKLNKEAIENLVEIYKDLEMKNKTNKSIGYQTHSIDIKEETYFLKEARDYRSKKIKSGETITFKDFANYVGQPRTTLIDKCKRLDIYTEIKELLT